ncbi:unnamed protein product [Mycena citricolor]|uniref:Uncharacterized protein n=1 Tax=Mycena citricolor TaxID=2018698 RepID=A0AAD2GY95_9AGAR|nr:unnamed protein product [Mycena citricolor]
MCTQTNAWMHRVHMSIKTGLLRYESLCTKTGQTHVSVVLRGGEGNWEDTRSVTKTGSWSSVLDAVQISVAIDGSQFISGIRSAQVP